MAPRRIRLAQTLFFFLAVSLVAPSVHAGDVTLRDLVEEALKGNRDIRAAEHRVEGYQNKIPQAGSFPDPMVGVGYQNDTLSSYREIINPFLGQMPPLRVPMTLINPTQVSFALG